MYSSTSSSSTRSLHAPTTPRTRYSKNPNTLTPPPSPPDEHRFAAPSSRSALHPPSTASSSSSRHSNPPPRPSSSDSASQHSLSRRSPASTHSSNFHQSYSSRNDEPLPSRPSVRKTYGTGPSSDSRKSSMNGEYPRHASAAPNTRRSTLGALAPAFPSSRNDPRRPSLQPRSAVANYFNLDFSFLDEPPSSSSSSASTPFPARPSSVHSLTRSGSAGGRRPDSIRSNSGGPLRDLLSSTYAASTDSLDESGWSVRSRTAPESPSSLRSASSRRLPFPSKPQPPSSISSRRRPSVGSDITSSSSMGRSKSLHSTSRRSSRAHQTYSPPSTSMELRNSFDGRRPSEVPSIESTRSSELSTSGSDPDLAFKRSRGFSPDASAAAVFSGYTMGSSSAESHDSRASWLAEEEKRKRLVVFLDETAAAMEGGKSLNMVLPESASSKDKLSLSQLAQVASPSLTPSAHPDTLRFSHLSYQSTSALSSPTTPSFDPRTTPQPPQPGGMPGPARYESRPSQQLDDYRATVYFTPTVPALPSPARSDEQQEELDLDGDHGLGLGMDFRSNGGLRPPMQHGSPSSFGTETPGSSPHAPHQEPIQQSEAERKHAKMAEKRRHTIIELIETEASYASDMAVVRDIYLARARGADMAAVADHVMSSGLGLGNIVGDSPPSPPPSATFQDMLSAGPPPPSQGARRPSMMRRTSFAPPPVPAHGEPLMSPQDLRTIFANLEDMAELAEAFAGVLNGAYNPDSDTEMDDRIGEVFVEMLPRIEQTYKVYCQKHDRAIVRLQELKPSLSGYLSECKTLSHGRTNAWDLASLLIKPVQRCLKYSALLQQILDMTPSNHPDRHNLLRASTDMPRVATSINENKRQIEVVDRMIKKDPYARRESTASVFAKKVLRSGQKVKQAMSTIEPEKDDIFDTLAALVDSTRSGALRFANDMRDWSRTTKTALDTQLAFVERWIDLYEREGEVSRPGDSHDRLVVFLENVLRPIMVGPWRDLDHDIRRSLLVRTEHLISMYENPRACILKRNDLLLAHSRYLSKKSLSDRKSSEEFVAATTQLVTELPSFLAQVSRYFDIIVQAFADSQATYHLAVSERWNQFAEQWCHQIPGGDYDTIESAYEQQHQDVERTMEDLRKGLGLDASKNTSPKSTRSSPARRSPADLRSSSSQVTARARNRQSTASYQSSRLSTRSNDYRPGSPNGYGTNRSSVNSTSSTAPSFAVSNSTNGSSSPTPMTPPPPPSANLKRTSVASLARPSLYRAASEQSFKNNHHHPLPPVPLFSEERTPPPTSSTSPRSIRSPASTVVRSPASTATRPLSSASVRSSGLARPPSSHTQREDVVSPSPRRPESVASLKKSTPLVDEHGEEQDEDTFNEDPNADFGRPRPEIGRRGMSDSRFESTISVYAEASEGYDDEDEEEDYHIVDRDEGHEEDEEDGEILYIAQAMASAKSTGVRSGFPLLSFEIGDRLHVEAEEADKAEGGSGWLLGTKEDGSRGWARTENFHIVEEDEE